MTLILESEKQGLDPDQTTLLTFLFFVFSTTSQRTCSPDQQQETGVDIEPI